jgi:hypothetical protein
MAEGRVEREERETLLVHLADCDSCRGTVLFLSAERRATTRKVFVARTAPFPWAAVAAVLLLAVAGWAVWKLRPEARKDIVKSPPRVDPRPEPEPPAPVPPRPDVPDLPPEPRPEPKVDRPPDPEPPVPKDPEPKPGPTVPEPPKPSPKDPPKPPPEPAREVASVRLLDVTGELLVAKKRVVEGQVTNASITAPSGGAFRVEGSLVALAKGTVATVGRVDGTLSIAVESGEACVEAEEASWRLGKSVMTLKGRALVSADATVLLSELPEREATKRYAPYRAFEPKQRTWFFDDFAERENGVLAGQPLSGMVTATVGTQVPYSRKAVLRFRYRATNAQTLRVEYQVDGAKYPRVAETGVKRGWQEIAIPLSRFDDPATPGEPGAGRNVFSLRWSVTGSSRDAATLEVDDVTVIERE